MSLVALALVLSAAVSHATWNLAAKRASDGGLAFVWLAALLATVMYAPVVLVAAHSLSLAAVGVIMLSGLVHLGYFLLLQRGYRLADLSVVYPLARGTGPLLSVTAAIVILGERPSAIA
ncbi:MAG: EamA family transporter, partial [Micromonosporaceae bacterium]